MHVYHLFFKNYKYVYIFIPPHFSLQIMKCISLICILMQQKYKKKSIRKKM